MDEGVQRELPHQGATYLLNAGPGIFPLAIGLVVAASGLQTALRERLLGTGVLLCLRNVRLVP